MLNLDMKNKLLEVFSSGGGTQSTCISALIIQKRLPRPDYVVIADTGREMKTTWQYMDAVVRPAFNAIGIEVHRILKDEFASPWGRELFATSGQLMIPAFTNQSGEVSKLSAFCSGAWKQETLDRWFAKTLGITRRQRKHWIGYSLDEPKRWGRMIKGKEFLSGLIRLPLVHDIPTRRHEALRIVEQMGWPKPPRSRCFDCPNQSDYEWAEVKTDYPEDFTSAIERDETMRLRDPHAFLHSTAKPLRDADLSAADDLFSGSCATGDCFI
jgi:hypothetical protein